MHTYISADVIYFYLILDKAIKSKSLSGLNAIRDFFKLNTTEDIFTYSTLKNILSSTIDVYKLRQFVLSAENKKNAVIKYLSKIHKLTELYLKEKIDSSDKNYKRKLSLAVNTLDKYPHSELALYLLEAAKFLFNHFSKKTKNIALSALYISLKEYFDLFIEANEIKFNEAYIYEKFKIYFDIFHIQPQTVLFINDKNNIKIMQEFFPVEKFNKLFKCLRAGIETTLKNKYFLIETDEKLCSETNTELLCHEIGHLLNLKIYNFQNIILNSLYNKNPNTDSYLLNSWLNEIIADIIGFNICDSKLFLKRFSQINNNIIGPKYPPLDFRKSILLNKEFNPELFNTEKEKQVGVLIQNNIASIKEMLRIIK